MNIVRGKGVNNAGVTLIEMMVVITLVGLMAGFGVPLVVSAFSQTTLEAAADEVSTALTFAQFTAASSGRPCRVTIDAAEETVVLEQEQVTASLLGSESQLAESTVEGTTWVAMKHPMQPFDDYRLNLSGDERFQDVEVASVTWDTGSYVEFDALGVPTTGGTIVLSNPNEQVSLTVEAVSGTVTMN